MARSSVWLARRDSPARAAPLFRRCQLSYYAQGGVKRQARLAGECAPRHRARRRAQLPFCAAATGRAQKHRGFSTTFLGTLDFIFLCSYAIGLYVSGSLGDRFNVKKVLLIGMVATGELIWLGSARLGSAPSLTLPLYLSIFLLLLSTPLSACHRHFRDCWPRCGRRAR